MPHFDEEKADSLGNILEPLDIKGDCGDVVSNKAGDGRQCDGTHGQCQHEQAEVTRLNVEGERTQGNK